MTTELIHALCLGGLDVLQPERAKIFGRNTMNKLIIAAAVAAAGFTSSAAIADVVGGQLSGRALENRRSSNGRRN